MNKETLRSWTARLLIGFVVFTLGFSTGRRTAPSLMPQPDPKTVETQTEKTPDKVIVYAAHMTFRCPECTQIEWLARGLVDAEFALEMAEDRLEFRPVDYMRDTAFARKYNISSSTIIVVRMENGEERDFQRLDEVWTKIRDREEFFDYVRSAILKSLDALGEEKSS